MDEHNLSCEPMDVDTSSNSTNAMDISYSEITLERPVSILENEDCNNIFTGSPKRKEVLINSERQNSYKSLKTLDKMLILASVVAITSFLIFTIFSIRCCNEINLKELKRLLHHRLFDQTKAINSLIESLESNEKSKIIVLFGSTGVGKTLAMSILLENITNYSNIYHYTKSSLDNNFSSELNLGLTLCKSAIVIVDDIKLEDKTIKNKVQELITKATDLGNKITIILIYNCVNSNKEFMFTYTNNFETELEQLFDDITASKSYIKFESLKHETLKKCIKYEFKNKLLNDIELLNVMKNFDVVRDGCKGVHQKIKYLSMK